MVKTVLVVDVSGSTRLYHEIGNESAHMQVQEAVSESARIVGTAGRIVKYLGDGFFALVPDLLETLRLCRQANQAVTGLNSGLGLRMGVHVGEVMETDTDAFGDAINVAFRVSDRALAGQVTAVSDVVMLLSAPMADHARLLGAVALQGKPGAHKLYDLSKALSLLP